MNVPHPACMRRELRTFRQLRKSWYMFLFQIPWLPEKLLTARRAKAVGDMFVKWAVDTTRFPDVVTDVYREAALTPGAMRSMLNWYRAGFRGRQKAPAGKPPVITTPTLMIWGLEDKALGRQTTDGTDRYVDHLTLRFLPDVSHWVQQEAPEIVNAMLLAWLDGHEVPEAADITYQRLDEPASALGPHR